MHIERYFIGGVLHGQYRAVPEEWIVVAEPVKVDATSPEHADRVIGVDVHVNRYLLLTFNQPFGASQNYEHKVFVIDKMSKEEAEQYLHTQKLRQNPGN